MIVWISRALALATHERQLAEHGGGAGIRDEALLESALARPRQLHAYGCPAPDLAGLAASLAYAMAKNHPFVDGNKRTAHACYRVFLLLNDMELAASQEEKYAQTLGLAAGDTSEVEFTAWVRKHVCVRGESVVNEPRVGYG